MYIRSLPYTLYFAWEMLCELPRALLGRAEAISNY